MSTACEYHRTRPVLASCLPALVTRTPVTGRPGTSRAVRERHQREDPDLTPARPPEGTTAALIGAALKRSGMSQHALAAAVGVEQGTIGHWVAGRRTPSMGNLMRAAGVLGVPVASLLPSPALPAVPPGAGEVAAVLMREFPLPRALAGSLAEVIAAVLSAEHEARRAWAAAGDRVLCVPGEPPTGRNDDD